MLNPPNERMLLGHAARRAGRTAEALDHYRSALEQEPGSAEANSVYGLMLLQLGRAGEAEAPLRKAVEIAPSHAALRMNLAQWLAHQGELDEAVRVVKGIVTNEPQHWWAWERLGELKARQRKFGEASGHFRRAVEIKPQDPSLLFKLARASFDDGRIDEAENILDDAARLAPGNAAILRLYAELYESRGNWAALEKTANAWTALQPRDPAPWRALAKAQWESGYPRRAMQNFQHSFTLAGRDAGSLATFGRLALHALDLEAAAKALDEAETLDPGNSAALSAKGTLRMWQGRHDEAQDYCRRAIGVNPRDATAYKTLTELLSGRLPDEEMAALRALTERDDTRIHDHISALFALGNCLDAADRIDEAFAAYERANRFAQERAMAEGLVYDPAARTQQTEELISLFDALFVPNAAVPSPRPIFILGMPRSGTTLIESVIAAHSRVVAGGESGGIRWILPDYLRYARDGSASAIPESIWAQWRAYYWQQLPGHDGAAAVTDKNPWNFDALGLILGLFPDARLIHVRRSAIETGFSIYRNEFSKLVRFTNRLEDIGHYYGEYARVMAHWERIAGHRITMIQYEDFVRRFDDAAPELLAACGLEWEEGCRTFWKNERPVSTISTMQVRRPPGKPSTRAQVYLSCLTPLVQMLESMGVDLETGGLRRKS
ncbi:MAG: sulfotransferase [Steroidobacteraceae bacterium]